MKKNLQIRRLRVCSMCRKMEHAISKIDGVQEVNVNFLTQKLTLVADDEKFESIVDEAVKICKKIEPDCRIIRK